MGLTFGSLWPFWLLALVPAVWIARIAGRGFHRRQQIVQGLTRSALLACLALALTQPVVSLPVSRMAIVYLVDVSHSVASRAVAGAAATIDAWQQALRPADAKILAFGGKTTRVADTAALRRLAARGIDDASDAGTASDETNLEQALSSARAEIPRGSSGRIVLFTDGRETDGDSRQLADRLSTEQVPVFVHVLAERDLGDTWIEEMRVPDGVSDGGLARLDVEIGSQRPTPAAITIRDAGRVVASSTTDLTAGVTTIAMDATFVTPGPHLVEVTVEAPNDVLAVNNTLAREIVVSPKPRVLFVRRAEAGDALPRALAQSAFEVTTVPPQRLPTVAQDFEPWDAVILSDVPRVAVTDASMSALATWVEKRGGGLLFAGGGAVFGEGRDAAATGYRNTALERLLPVTFEREDAPEIALVTVLDRSWSMLGEKLDLCKTATDAAVDTLSDAQLVGVVTFNDQFEWNVPLDTVGSKRAAIHEAISRITPSGPTLIYPALEQAYRALLGVRARAKHVVLLSDGQTQPDDYEALLKKMAAAKITVSTVALGPDADVALLGDLATWGKGRKYVVRDANEMPQIFVKEAKNASTPGFEEGKGLVALVRQPAFFKDAGLAAIPPLLGRNAVTRRDASIDLVTTADGDPLLSLWPVGLGRAAMFAADVDGGWTSSWPAWRGYGPFFSTVVRSIARARPAALTLTVTPEPRAGAWRTLSLTVDARHPDGTYHDLLSPVADVRTEGAASERVALSQIGPGRYTTSAVADGRRPIRLTVADVAGSSVSHVFASDGAAEYRFGPPDTALLTSIARVTHGMVNPTPDDLRRAPLTSGATRRPLAPLLLFFALMLWLADIALRRVRLFEPRRAQALDRP